VLSNHTNYRSVLDNKPWSIIGAGPVGSMQAMVFAAIFPGQTIHVLDRYRQNVRGHGLEIHKKTIEEILQYFSMIKKMTIDMLQKKRCTAEELVYYERVISNIDNAKHFLKQNFTRWAGDVFVRTNKICEMLQEFTRSLSEGSVIFHDKHEVQVKHLQELMSPIGDDKVYDETQEILVNSSNIIGSDGAHSRVREIVFNENNQALHKEVLSYLLEIKLEMKRDASSFDKLQKSALPSLTKGDLHIWNQSRDNTATLHIFIDKKTFDMLRSKTHMDKPMGEFTNPYRCLHELPEHLQKPIEKSIVDVIGIENFDANTLKITTIPMHVFKAKQLVRQVNGRNFALVGDSAVGLTLANGVNNGFCSAAAYGLAYYYRRLHRHSKPDYHFHKFQLFKDTQYNKFENFLTDLLPSFPAIIAHVNVIRDRYEAIFNEMLVNPGVDTKQHQKKVLEAEMKYISFLQDAVATPDDLFRLNVRRLFSDFYNRELLVTHKPSELHLCEMRIKTCADNNIRAIKRTTRMIDIYQRTVGGLLSGYRNAKSSPEENHSTVDSFLGSTIDIEIHALQQFLLGLRSSKNQSTAQFVFDIDRVYLELKNKVRALKAEPSDERENSLILLVRETRSYAEFILNQRSATVAAELVSAAEYKRLVERNNCGASENNVFQHAIEAAKKINHYDKKVIPQMVTDVVTASTAGIQKYLARDRQHLSMVSSIFDKNRGLIRGKFYQSILQADHLHQYTKLAIIFIMLSDNAGKTLQRDVVEAVSGSHHRINSADAGNEIAKLMASYFPRDQIENLSNLLVGIVNKIHANQTPQAELDCLQDLVAEVSQPASLPHLSLLRAV
jgi:2-polyprenyl-6-methoxyphenol hydroxylase-like FAD-dependent oxidoreductase